MSATFACPHCGASYPRKPVLVGRAVRCTTCKNAFRLREDGIADKVEMEAPAAPTQPAPPPRPVTPPPAAVPTPAPAPAARSTGPKLPSTGWGLDLNVDVEEPKIPAKPAPTVVEKPVGAPPAAIKSPLPREAGTSDNRKSARMTAQQLEARRAMAATLSTSMSAALKSEAVKREEQSEKAKAKTEGRVGKIGPAVLTGEGVQEARTRRLTLLGTLGVFALIGTLYWLLFTDSPERAALTAYTAEVDPGRIRAGERVQTIQARAWLVGLPPADVGTPPLIDMRDARIGSTRVINLAAARDLFTSLKGLVPVEPGPVWVPPDRLAAVEDVRRPDQKPEAFIAAVLKREKKAVSHPAFLESLTKTGMSKEDADIVDLFIRGRTADVASAPAPDRAAAAGPDPEKPDAVEPGAAKPDTTTSGTEPEAEKPAPPSASAPATGNAISRRWMDGDVPATLQVTRFYGSRGTMLLSRGQSFKTTDVEYDGRMARFTGPGWPEEWRVLTIETKMKQRF